MIDMIIAAETQPEAPHHAGDWRKQLETILRQGLAELQVRRVPEASLADVIEMIWPELRDHFGSQLSRPNQTDGGSSH